MVYIEVQAVLLLLGQGELPPGSTAMVLPNQNENKHSFCRGMRTYFGGQTFLQKGLLLYLGSVKSGRKEILTRKYVMQFAKKLHSGCSAERGNLLEGPVWRENLQLLAVILGSQSSGLDFVSRESKCQNCGTSEKMTPAMRRGPAGPRTLCNACGLMWANKGMLRSCPKAKVESPVVAIEQGGSDNKALVTPKNDNVSASNGEAASAAETGTLKAQ